jgi:hypothetical protein
LPRGRGSEGRAPKAPTNGHPHTQKAFEFAVDGTKQLLTLSAAILALTVTIARDIAGDPNLLLAAWIAFLVSVVCGVLALYALMVEFGPGKRGQDEAPTLVASGVRAPAFAQIGAFLVGVAFLVRFGWSVVENT